MSKKKQTDMEFIVQIVAIVILAGFLIFSWDSSSASAGSVGIVSASDVMPTGVPAIYGKELEISFNDVSASNAKLTDETIRLLGNIDRSETLEGAELERYINVLYNLEGGISCEFCCGARSIIFEDGKAACGCAHSYAMRGLAKYLIKYHGDEFSDEQILSEVAKWKILFFPGIHEGKAAVMEAQGIEVNPITLASNQYRGIEKGQASGSMVGGC